ncbi:MAG: molybdopterin molybdotransferase MoeA, partial [Pseudomonadota bacterium]
QEWKDGHRDFPVESVIFAGEPPKQLSKRGYCLVVMTGSVLPIGTDSVIPYEELSIEQGTAKIKKDLSFSAGQYVHPEGSDFKAGDELLRPGQILHAAAVGVTASQGYAEILVGDLPKVCLVTTGNEIVELGQNVLPHQIRRSNFYSLQTQLSAYGVEQIENVHLPDDPLKVQENLEYILSRFSVVIICGGVSAGKLDLIPRTLKALGIKEVFHTVAQKPGKPLWFGTGKNNQLVWGLPGNPISALVTLRRYVIPALFKAQGYSLPAHQYAVLGEDWFKNNDLAQFLLVRLESDQHGITQAYPIDPKNSGDLGALRLAQGFIEVNGTSGPFFKARCLPLYTWGRGDF